MIGTTISHYRVLEKVGAGGMGIVYKAQDTRLHRFVALKFLPDHLADNQQLRERFQREARAASALNHPNICTIYDIGEADGRAFMAMEFLDGTTLKDLVIGARLELDRLVDIAVQVLDGLETAHAQHVIHRDIKPANIFITSTARVKILDFGLAKINVPSHSKVGAAAKGTLGSGEYMTTGGGTLGTMPYMSPEQALGKPMDARSDLFSFGVTLYEMATGKMPFQGDTTGALFLSIVQGTPVPAVHLNPDIPDELQRIIEKCLEKDRDLRYQHASDIRSDLKRLGRDSRSSSSGISAVAEPLVADAPSKQSSIPSGISALPQAPKSEVATVAKRTHRKIWASLLALVAALLATSIFYRRSHNRVALTDKDTVVLADFANTTGDTIFDDPLKTALMVDLSQSPFLNVLSDNNIAATLKLMTQAADTKLTPEVARDVCQRSGGKAYIAGSIASLGTEYVLGLKAVNCQDGNTLAQQLVTASAKEKVLGVLDQATSTLRTQLGESLASVQKFDVPLEQATTPSLAALKAYSLGQQLIARGDSAGAARQFQRAINLDPRFAMAYAQLGTAYHNLGEKKLAAVDTERSFALRDRVSQIEKFYIESHYYHFLTGNLEEARKVYELWAKTYPRDIVPPANLGVLYQTLGLHDKALEESHEALRRVPNDGLTYANLVITYICLNRLNEAVATAAEAQAKNLDSPDLHLYLYELGFLQHDGTRMAQQSTWATGTGQESVLLYFEASTAAYSGELNKSQDLFRRAVTSAERAAQIDRAAETIATAALSEALFGNAAEARKQAQAATALSVSKDGQFVAALALAMARDPSGAQGIADKLAKSFPEDTIVQLHYLPTIRAQLALERNDTTKAAEALRAVEPYELGIPGGTTFLANLYPVYIRAEVYLAEKKGARALAEFQKIIDSRGIVADEPIGALAQVGLARAYVVQGDTAKARSAYENFLALWKNADPEIPILKQAKAEYTKLQQSGVAELGGVGTGALTVRIQESLTWNVPTIRMAMPTTIGTRASTGSGTEGGQNSYSII